jgi:hypothetical protein
LLSWYPGAWLIARVLRLNKTVHAQQSLFDEHLPLSGWIGVFERWIVIYLILHGQIVGVGFLVTAKGLLRMPEIRDTSDPKIAPLLSSYILLGTLVSFLLAILLAEAALKLRACLSA